MRYKWNLLRDRIPLAVRAFFLALLWLAFISGMHYRLNVHQDTRPVVTMGYMPVITNLAAPLIDYASQDTGDVRFQSLKFASFAEMAEALRNNRIQAAFMIAPLSIVLKQQGEDVKIIYIGNRHESTLVVRKDLPVRSLSDLNGKTLAVPMRYSGHNLSILQLMEKNNLVHKINVVEMNPPDMASALATGSLDAYYVGEPFAAQTLKSGDAKLFTYVEDVWHDFICNLVLVKGEFIENTPDLVMQLTQAAIRSGIWARRHPREAAALAADYWNQPPELIEYALTTPKNRIVYDRYVPHESEIQYLADQMVRFKLIAHNRIDGLVVPDFALRVNTNGIRGVHSILAPETLPSPVAATRKLGPQE